VEDDRFDAVVLDSEGTHEECRVRARFGETVALPRDCARQTGALKGPGVARALRLVATSPLHVSAIDVRTGIAWIEAESFRNVVDDGGGDAGYSLGTTRAVPSNGVSMVCAAGWAEPIDLKKEVALAPGDYAAWARVLVFPARFGTTRADIVFDANGREVGTLGPWPSDALPFWDELGQFEWEPIGEFHAQRSNALTVSFHWRSHAAAAFADIDAIALVPLSLDQEWSSSGGF
jgi:hypothetical protein